MDGQTDGCCSASLHPSSTGSCWKPRDSGSAAAQSFPLGMMSLLEEYIKMHQIFFFFN